MITTAPMPDRLRIAQVAPLWTRVPPVTYGGAELLVHWLTEALTRDGHDVTLFASADSLTSATLAPACDMPLIETMRQGRAYAYEGYALSALAHAVCRRGAFDVIHSHVGPLGIPLGELPDVPMVHTVHAGLDSVDEHWLLDRHPRAWIAAISDSQVATVGPERRGRITTIYHGLDFASYAFGPRHDGYLLFIGRMGPQKNPAGAIRIARAAGVPLVLVGRPQDRREQQYFREQVEPLLGASGVRYEGAVDHDRKVALLRGAAALLFPIQWEEHFGLVMIEAMACGTPVVAWRRGSVPEVVDAGTTGYYGSSEEELSALIPAAMALDRYAIREHAQRRFAVARMAGEYVAFYRRVIAAGHRRGEDAPLREAS